MNQCNPASKLRWMPQASSFRMGTSKLIAWISLKTFHLSSLEAKWEIQQMGLVFKIQWSQAASALLDLKSYFTSNEWQTFPYSAFSIVICPPTAPFLLMQTNQLIWFNSACFFLVFFKKIILAEHGQYDWCTPKYGQDNFIAELSMAYWK